VDVRYLLGVWFCSPSVPSLLATDCSIYVYIYIASSFAYSPCVLTGHASVCPASFCRSRSLHHSPGLYPRPESNEAPSPRKNGKADVGAPSAAPGQRRGRGRAAHGCPSFVGLGALAPVGWSVPIWAGHAVPFFFSLSSRLARVGTEKRKG
jgi:hypothetical protein